MFCMTRSAFLGIAVLTIAAIVGGEENDSNSSSESKEVTARLDLGDIASELLGRQSNSQVLSLNVTNLIILLVLKGLLFGASYWGGGGYYGGYPYKARSLETSELINEQEVMLITSFLMGDAEKDFSCLYRVACQDPSKSKSYVQGAKILLKTSKIFSEYVGYDEKYETLVRELQDAVDFGTKYGTCEQKYSCNKSHDQTDPVPRKKSKTKKSKDPKPDKKSSSVKRKANVSSAFSSVNDSLNLPASTSRRSLISSTPARMKGENQNEDDSHSDVSDLSCDDIFPSRLQYSSSNGKMELKPEGSHLLDSSVSKWLTKMEKLHNTCVYTTRRRIRSCTMERSPTSWRSSQNTCARCGLLSKLIQDSSPSTNSSQIQTMEKSW
ncbi:unnamed protein product [Nesidiocoris tenuis]|nr:unnamed protein product [Nesidiocoris tenuis]